MTEPPADITPAGESHSTTVPPAPRWRTAARETTSSSFFVLMLVGLAVLPYLNALDAGFTFDDEFQVRTNPAVTGGVDVIRILSSPLYPGDLFRPFTVFTFALNERLAPGMPWPFHFANVVLHAAVTIFVYLLAKRLFNSLRLAVIAGVLFAVHPIHTEAVTSVVGRAELLAALFGLGTLLAAVRAEATAGASKAVFQLLSLVSFSLALLSKESALTVLPLMLLLRITLRREPLRVGLWREFRGLDWVPYALCAGVFVVLRSYVVRAEPIEPLDNVLAYAPWAIRIRSALGILWDYFGLVNLPLVLAADYSYDEVPAITSWLAPRFWGGLALLLLAAAACFRRRYSTIAFTVQFPFVALALTANILFPIGTIKAERLLYFPSAGWAILAGFGVEHLLCRRRYRFIAATGLCLMTAAFAARTWTRNADWRDNDAVYRSMVRSAPNSAKAHYNFGLLLLKQDRIEAASVQFHRALEIYRWAEGAALGIGLGFERRAHTDEAVEWYRKALEITPSLRDAHVSLCRVLVNSGRFEEAAVACRRGLRYTPANPDLLKGLGASLVETGAIPKGTDVLRRSLTLNERDEGLRAYLQRFDGAALPSRDPSSQ